MTATNMCSNFRGFRRSPAFLCALAESKRALEHLSSGANVFMLGGGGEEYIDSS